MAFSTRSAGVGVLAVRGLGRDGEVVEGAVACRARATAWPSGCRAALPARRTGSGARRRARSRRPTAAAGPGPPAGLAVPGRERRPGAGVVAVGRSVRRPRPAAARGRRGARWISSYSSAHTPPVASTRDSRVTSGSAASATDDDCSMRFISPSMALQTHQPPRVRYAAAQRHEPGYPPAVRSRTQPQVVGGQLLLVAGSVAVGDHGQRLGVRVHHPVRRDRHGLVREVVEPFGEQPGGRGLAAPGLAYDRQHPSLLVGEPAGVQVEPLARGDDQRGQGDLGRHGVVAGVRFLAGAPSAPRPGARPSPRCSARPPAPTGGPAGRASRGRPRRSRS